MGNVELKKKKKGVYFTPDKRFKVAGGTGSWFVFERLNNTNGEQISGQVPYVKTFRTLDEVKAYISNRY